MYTFNLKDHVRASDWTIESAEYDVMEGKKLIAVLKLRMDGIQADVTVKTFDYVVSMDIAKAWFSAKVDRPGALKRDTLVCSTFWKNHMMAQHARYN